VREQSKRELAGRPTAEVVEKARKWWREVAGRVGVPPAGVGVPPTRTSAAEKTAQTESRPKDRSGETPEPAGGTPTLPESSDRALCEVLGVFEAHDTPEPDLLEVILKGSDDARAYGASVLNRWYEPLQKMEHPGSGLRLATHLFLHFAGTSNLRVRAAALAAAAEINRRESLTILSSPIDEDKFTTLAGKIAVERLRPHMEEAFAHIPREKWEVFFPILRSSKAGEKPSAPSVVPKPAIVAAVAATGQLKATPEFVAALVKEVREQGNAQRGAEVFRRAELACVTCHSLDDKGGKIGPPLDAIGSGQPLDFIIGATLEPQREIKESYEAMQMTAKDGRVAIGYIAQRTAEGTTLRDPASGAETRFAAAEIAEFKPIGSLMPAGLVDRLSREDLRDLFRYLSELGKPR
jgi:putative heme-binding domain-containing protein